MGNGKSLIENLLKEGNVFQRRLGVASFAGMYSEIDWSFLQRSAHSLGILKEAEDLQREIKRYRDKFTEMTKTDVD